LQAGQFIAEVWGTYLRHFWLLFELSAPAGAVAYLAITIARRTNWEIARHLRGSGTAGHPREAFQIWLVALLGYFVCCVASHFAFGAIAAAMAQIATGIPGSPRDVLATVRNRTVPLLRLSLLLFVLILTAVGARQLFVAWFFQVTHGRPYYQSTFVLELLAVGTGGIILLVMSRFGVAVPALMLENCGAGRAMFRSDELTEGKWPILAASVSQLLLLGNLSKFVHGWIVHRVAASFLSGSWLPWADGLAWIALNTIASLPFFVGFVLLYLRRDQTVVAAPNVVV
jgi:nitrate reductase NapE component